MNLDESVTLDNAVRHLTNRFKGDSPITVSYEDRVSLNKIIDHLNQSQENKFVKNILFAKLYVFGLGYFLDKFNTTIDNPIPHKELHKLLQLPFNYLISELTDSMNLRMRYAILENAGCNLDKHPRMLSRDECKRNVKNLQKQLSIKNNYQIFMNGAWTVEEVENGIKSELKEFTNDL